MTHNVHFCIPEREIGSRPIIVSIYRDKKKLGELHIGKQNLGWRSRNGKVTKTISWKSFDNLVRDNSE